MKTTVYIPDNKKEMYRKAQKKLGESISSIFVRCLERELENQELKTSRLIVELVDRDGNMRKQSFEGRWLVEDEEHYFGEDEEGAGIQMAGERRYSVAITKNGRIVVVESFQDQVSKEVFETVEQFKKPAEVDGCPMYPQSLISAVSNELGEEHIEELDI